MRVVALSGSLRNGSHNTRLLHVAIGRLPAGSDVEIWAELGEVPAFDEDAEHPTPPAVERLKSVMSRADAVLIATPEYNGSIPGTLKNALDWVSRPYAENPLMNKPAAVMGTSTGLFGAAWAQADLRRVLKTIGARVIDSEVVVPTADHAFAGDALRLADADLDAALTRTVLDLTDSAERRLARLATT